MMPVDGGFDEAGNLTRDPAAIERSWRPLPVGYWKGSGLSVVLDMIAAMMSLGRATHELSSDPLFETGISQMFVAMNPQAFGPSPRAEEIAGEVVASLHGCKPVKEGGRVRYPGEQTLRVRAENEKLGLPVEPAVWEQVFAGG
jgi:3-dehydro-L-gulonate 2-dehydrogenase